MALEAAVRRCAPRAGRAAVHGLRTATRRIEAQLVLLSLLPGLPPHKAQEGEVQRLLRRLRHRAGVVRDIDVQRELVRNEVAGGVVLDRVVLMEARRLKRVLKVRREKEAERLARLLRKERKKLPIVFEELLAALEAAEGTVLTETRLVGMVREWFGRKSEVTADGDSQRTAELHEARKRAKVARYLAESAGEDARGARRLAGRFEKLQAAGGDWHDWLLLAQVAAKQLGEEAELPRRFRAYAEGARRGFERRLRYRM
jgi:CHAD domain-containing protein